MDGMRDPYPALRPDELTAWRHVGGLGKHVQLYHAYTLIALELATFDPEGRQVVIEAGHQWLREADAERAGNDSCLAVSKGEVAVVVVDESTSKEASHDRPFIAGDGDAMAELAIRGHPRRLSVIFRKELADGVASEAIVREIAVLAR
jgi:hypothetical protein